jgi:signal transduction histidine kinase
MSPPSTPAALRGAHQMRVALLPMLAALLATALALLLAVAWLGAPMPDLMDLGAYLGGSCALSLALGLLGMWWLRRGRAALWLQISLTYGLGVAIALLNIFLTARLMFISSHDLPLLILLLLFAAVVSLGLGYALAHTLARRVTALHQGAQRLAEGDLAARVPAEGRDELARLAHEFNRMAEQLAASAEERGRMEQARRELVAAVSHDLRTPLTSLRAMIEALSDGLIDDPATTARYLATMRGQVTHLSGLIDDLFELAQIEAGALQLELQRVDPSDLISDTIEGMRPQAAARGVMLEGSVAPEAGALLIAPQKIERVLYNLVTNAVRHTPAEGSVTLRVYLQADQRPTTNDQRPPEGGVGGLPPAASPTSPVSRREALAAAGGLPPTLPPTALSARERGRGFAVFVVEDTGEGIAPEDLPFVFDRFYRGEKSRSRATGGAGLGLAIARGIVEAHGGRIWIEPNAPRGTRVIFALPLA